MAEKIDELIVSINADIARFKKRMKSAEKQLGGFEKQTQKVSDKMAGHFRRMANSASIMTGPLGGVAGRLSGIASGLTQFGAVALGASAATAGFTLAMVKANREGEKFELQQLRLGALLKSTGNTVGLTQSEITQFTRELALNTLTSTEAAQDAAATLLTFRSVSGETFKEALTLAQDLAATGFGNLKGNAVQLGKALEDPVKGISALARSGVSFSDSQKTVIQNMVETGRLADAQTMILQTLRNQVGGAGSAQAGGLAGAYDTLGQRVEEFFLGLANNTNVVQTSTSLINGLANAVAFLNEKLGVGQTEIQLEEKALQSMKLRLDELEESRKKAANRSGRMSDASSRNIAPIRILKEEIVLQEQKIQRLIQEEAARKANAEAAADQLKSENALEIARAKQKETDDTAANKIAALQQELVMMDKLTKLDQIRFEIDQGAYAEFTEQQKLKLEQLATEIDRKRQILELEKETGLTRQELREQELEQAEIKRGIDERNMGRINDLFDFYNKGEKKRQEIVDNSEGMIQSFREKSMSAQGSIIAGGMEKITSTMSQKSRTMFEINKVAGIANATINTATGVTKALELPWPLNLAAAASTLAAGIAQIQTIQSQQFGASSAATASAPSAAADTAAPAEPAAPKEILVQGLDAGALLTSETVRALIEQINEEGENGVRIIT